MFCNTIYSWLQLVKTHYIQYEPPWLAHWFVVILPGKLHPVAAWWLEVLVPMVHRSLAELVLSRECFWPAENEDLFVPRLHNGAEYTGDYPGAPSPYPKYWILPDIFCGSVLHPGSRIGWLSISLDWLTAGMDEEKLLAWHRPRAKALLEAGCDLFACETVQEPQSQIWNRLAATGS